MAFLNGREILSELDLRRELAFIEQHQLRYFAYKSIRFIVLKHSLI